MAAESAVCAAARDHGGSVVAVDGWTLVADFGDPAAEYQSLREDAAIVDLPFRARVRATGADRIAFLQGMLSNDVAALQPGGGCHALLLTEQGKVVADLVVLAAGDAVLLDGQEPAVAAAVSALERFIVADDVELAPLAAAEHSFGVYGPRAAGALARLGVAVLPAGDFQHRTGDVAGVPTSTARVPAPGAGGFLCVVPEESAAIWWSRVVAAGVRPAGHRAYEALRIESGVPWYGRDVGPETIALEAPLEDAISFRKGCYLGQEVMERVSARGHVNRKLVGLEAAASAALVAGERLFAGERDVGWITSSCWSWRFAKPIALGYVRREHLVAGTVLATGASAGAATVVVRPLPFA